MSILLISDGNKQMNKGKKNYLAQIPHITNIDPFSNNQVGRFLFKKISNE
jgi:hypothetical protein